MSSTNSKMHTVIIDGVTYEFYHLSIRLLNKLLFKVLKVVGPSIASNLDKELGNSKEQVILSVVNLFQTSLDPDQIDSIIVELLSSTMCVGKGKITPDNFDVIFTDIMHMWKVVIEAGKYYFASFFAQGSLLDKALQKVKGMEQKELQSKTTMTS